MMQLSSNGLAERSCWSEALQNWFRQYIVKNEVEINIAS